jgi:hypothetical protein
MKTDQAFLAIMFFIAGFFLAYFPVVDYYAGVISIWEVFWIFIGCMALSSVGVVLGVDLYQQIKVE